VRPRDNERRSDSGRGPTAENVDGLPSPIRDYIHDLATNCDPSGNVQTVAVLRENVKALTKQLSVSLIDDDLFARLHRFDPDHEISMVRTSRMHDSEWANTLRVWGMMIRSANTQVRVMVRFAHPMLAKAVRLAVEASGGGMGAPHPPSPYPRHLAARARRAVASDCPFPFSGRSGACAGRPRANKNAPAHPSGRAFRTMNATRRRCNVHSRLPACRFRSNGAPLFLVHPASDLEALRWLEHFFNTLSPHPSAFGVDPRDVETLGRASTSSGRGWPLPNRPMRELLRKAP
jgi:hypothetical protein